jgi:integrase
LTRTQAEAEMRRLMTEVRPAQRTTGDALTITDLGARYIAHIERQGRKLSTVVAVRSVTRIWLVPFFGERDMRRVRSEDVRDLVRLMESGSRPGPRAKGDRRFGRPVAAKTLRNYIGTLSALLTFAERQGWVSSNVARRVDLPRAVPNEDIRFLEAIEVQALADAVLAGPHQAIDRALYLTAAMTGLRQGELVALRWRDVDWPAGRIRVRQNYVLGEFGTPKSKRSTRSVPMADVVGAGLDRLYLAAGQPTDDDLVFRSLRDRSTRPRFCAATVARSRRRSSTSDTASTTCDTRSEHAWPRPECRCVRCRSGWATATLKRRSATPTTRRARTSRHSSKRRSDRRLSLPRRRRPERRERTEARCAWHHRKVG